MSEPLDDEALDEAALPPAPAGAAARPERTLRPLEAILVAVAFLAGIGLTAFAMATEPKEVAVSAAPASPSPIPSPASPAPSPTGPTAPSPAPEPVPEGPVLFRSARSGFLPGNTAVCEADVFWEWEPDRSTDPPFGETARIRVMGPGIAGIHEATLTRRGLRLELHVPLSGTDRWTARPISVGGRRITEFPLEVSSDYPFC